MDKKVTEIDAFIEDLFQWQEKKFPQSTALSSAHHLESEVKELIVELEDQVKTEEGLTRNTCFELADCFMILFHIMKKQDLTLRDMEGFIDMKREIVTKREYKEPNELGFCEHVKEEDK